MFKLNRCAVRAVLCAALVFVCGGSLALLAGCSKGAAKASMASGGSFAYADFDMPTEELAVADMEAAMPVPSPALARESKSAATASADAGEPSPADGRKLIYNGNVNLQVENLAETERAVKAWVEQWGGYITNTSAHASNLSVTARIPVAHFQDAFGETSAFGQVERRSVSSQDVTEQFYDVYTRLETRKILRERLQNYLKEASSMQDMLAVEAELNNVQSDIEEMEGQLRRLSNRIDFATIEIYAHLPPHTTERGFVYPDVGGKFRQFWSDMLGFLASFLVGIFYVVCFGVPLLGAVLLLFWLCFGRVGVVRRLFALAAGKGKGARKDS